MKKKENTMRIYRRDPATNIWKDDTGNTFVLDSHGDNRIDLVPCDKDGNVKGSKKAAQAQANTNTHKDKPMGKLIAEMQRLTASMCGRAATDEERSELDLLLSAIDKKI